MYFHIFNFQCVGKLILVLFAPLPSSLAISFHVVVFCLFSLVQGTLIALSITRTFLILKVNINVFWNVFNGLSLFSRRSSTSLTMEGISSWF